MITKQKISPNLWFDHQAEEAANYYVSIFDNSSIRHISRYGSEGFEIHKMPAGTVMTVEFELEGQEFVALNGGPVFQFNEAVSFIVHCRTQKEIDSYWERLSAQGDQRAQQCGWLKDKFGVSWQVVPDQLSEMLRDRDREKSNRVMKAMLQMKKLNLAELEHAYRGEFAMH